MASSGDGSQQGGPSGPQQPENQAHLLLDIMVKDKEPGPREPSAGGPAIPPFQDHGNYMRELIDQDKSGQPRGSRSATPTGRKRDSQQLLQQGSSQSPGFRSPASSSPEIPATTEGERHKKSPRSVPQTPTPPPSGVLDTDPDHVDVRTGPGIENVIVNDSVVRLEARLFGEDLEARLEARLASEHVDSSLTVSPPEGETTAF